MHIASRWYRAPEISLIQDYDTAQDMWSFGCCLYELIHMMKSEHKIMFQGDSCYPLSPKIVNNTKLLSNSDQVKIIINRIDPLKDQDLVFI